LNSGAKGGLLLSNVNITNLDSIPAGTGYFLGVDTPADMDVNPGLRGAIVYNTNETTGAGIYVWNGKWWWPAATPDNEQILFTIRTTDGNYAIPTAGFVGGTYSHAYDWDITVDGQPAGADGHYTGTGEEPFDGIPLTLTNGVNHQIRITPHGGADPGWGNAFGYCDSIFGAHTAANKQKLISIDAPITTMAFAPKIAEANSTINASFMFAWLFTGCSNLTTPAVITDTYKLPETITNLSHFLYYSYASNSALVEPINLAPLKDWFKGNNSIENLSGFLTSTHVINSAIAAPINLTPLKDWFINNTSISNLADFLNATHNGGASIASSIDLAPLRDWFNGNNSIENLANFLAYTHSGGNSNIVVPINLEPLKDWFNGNNSIKNMSYFLTSIHHSNTALTKPIDFLPLSGWFSGTRAMTNLTGFLDRTHNNNPGFTLTGQFIFPAWIKTMKLTDETPIWKVENAFFRTFYLGASQNNNTEPTFQGGTTTLSSLGNPTVPNLISTDPETSISTYTDNKGTYTNRNGITPSNNNNSWITE
jgi:hypothetical protein